MRHKQYEAVSSGIPGTHHNHPYTKWISRSRQSTKGIHVAYTWITSRRIEPCSRNNFTRPMQCVQEEHENMVHKMPHQITLRTWRDVFSHFSKCRIISLWCAAYLYIYMYIFWIILNLMYFIYTKFILYCASCWAAASIVWVSRRYLDIYSIYWNNVLFYSEINLLFLFLQGMCVYFNKYNDVWNKYVFSHSMYNVSEWC